MPKLNPTIEITAMKGRTISMTSLVVLGLVLLTAGGLKLRNSLKSPATEKPTETAQTADTVETMDQLVKKVARHIVVKQEDPTIATVQDPEILRNQNEYFYKDVQVGDRVLAWSDKVVLYSTQRDLILAVLPISVVAPSSTAQVPEKEVASIEVRNGSKTVGLGSAVSTQLKSEGYDIAGISDADLKTYSKTVVFNASGKELPQTIKTLAEKLNAEVVAELSTEKNIKGDILVVVGSEYKQ